MTQDYTFSDFIKSICLRPNMYTLGGTYNEVVAYIFLPSSVTSQSREHPSHRLVRCLGMVFDQPAKLLKTIFKT
jgi:hypothetical protein